MQEIIKSEVKDIFSLLSGGKFVVPWHQRYYDWSPDNVEDLLEDLSAAFQKKDPLYFLGTIMLIEGKDGTWEINDGQQRLITLSLLFAHLRQFLSDAGDSGRAKNALRIIFDIDERDNPSLEEIKDLDARIQPPATNRANYNLLIHGQSVGKNGKMVSASECIVNFLLDKSKGNAQWIPGFLDYITKNLQVIELRVGHGPDSNSIFETLNFRGKPLEDVDLIRNYFYSFFGRESDEKRREIVYNEMEGIYKKAQSHSKMFGEYMRCHLQAIYGHLQSKRLYSEVKKQISETTVDSKEKVFSLVTELAKNHRIAVYRLLQNPSSNIELAKELEKMTTHARKTQNKRQIEDYLKDLRRYKVAHPVLFALLCLYVEAIDNQSKKSVAPFVYACCKLISSFVMRVSHVQTFQPSHYEVAFGDLAKSILTRECQTKQQFFKTLQGCDERTHVIPDELYIKAVKNVRSMSDHKCRVFLSAIAAYKQKDIVVDAKLSTIEHILPRSPDYLSGWSAFKNEDHSGLVNCPGNLTLLSVKDNRGGESANKNFSAKKRIYQKSGLDITKEICQYDKWSPKTVGQRQAALAKAAAGIWNFDGMNKK